MPVHQSGNRQGGTGDPPRRYEEGDTELIGGIGLTGGPSMLLLAGEMSYHLNEDSAIGPLVQVGVSGDDTFLGVSFHYKHHFYLDEGGALSRFRPFAQGGLGFAYLAMASGPASLSISATPSRSMVRFPTWHCIKLAGSMTRWVRVSREH